MSEGEAHPDGEITTERRGDILVVGFDRPAKYTGLTPRMMRALEEAFGWNRTRLSIAFSGVTIPSW